MRKSYIGWWAAAAWFFFGSCNALYAKAHARYSDMVPSSLITTTFILACLFVFIGYRRWKEYQEYQEDRRIRNEFYKSNTVNSGNSADPTSAEKATERVIRMQAGEAATKDHTEKEGKTKHLPKSTVCGIVAAIVIITTIAVFIDIRTAPNLKGNFVPLFRTNNAAADTLKDEEPVSPEPTFGNGDIRNYYNAKKVEHILNELQTEFKNADIRYRYDHANHALYFEITDKAYDEYFIEQVKEGDRRCQTMWEYLIKRVIAQQKRIQNMVVTAKINEDDNTCIVFNVYDPRDSERVFLTVASGIAGYDIVKDSAPVETE